MDSTRRILFMIVLSSITLPALSHPGRLNNQGCHNNYATGDYHCHGKDEEDLISFDEELGDKLKSQFKMSRSTPPKKPRPKPRPLVPENGDKEMTIIIHGPEDAPFF